MKIALIDPVHHLGEVPDTGYYMVLAHLAAQYPHYRDYYSLGAIQKRRGELFGHTCILDNGAAEGNCLEIADLLDLAHKMRPSYLIMPDDLEDPQTSHCMTIDALEFCHEVEFFNGHDTRPMLVPHGNTYPEWCMYLMMLLSGAKRFLPECVPPAIGIAKKHTNLADNWETQGRLSMAQEAYFALRDIYPFHQPAIHLLGLQYTPNELGLVASGYASGVDTALHWVAARHYRQLHGYMLARPNDWHSDEEVVFTDERVVELAKYNADVLIRLAKRGWHHGP